MFNVSNFVFEPLRYEFLLRGMLISIFLGVSGGILGCSLVLRRMSLMGDALSHSLLPGLGLAYLLFGPSRWAMFAGALIAGLLTAMISALISRLTRIKEDAAFGALFVLFFGLGIGLINFADTKVDLQHFLFGNILAVSGEDLWLAAGASTFTLLIFALFYRNILLESFDPVFHRLNGYGGLTHLGILALVVLNLVAALQAMGVVLAIGLFLLPAVTAYLWCDHWDSMLLFAAICGAASAVAGLFLSYYLSVSSGAAIVCSLGILFLLSALFSPKHGIVGNFLKSHRNG
jgi:zinc/manganese transport system permease protein